MISGINRLVIIDWKSIIDCYTLPYPIDEEPNSIGTVRRFVGGCKNSLNNKRVFTDGRHRRQQVAIAQFALLDIVGLDFPLKNCIGSLHKLRWPLPLHKLCDWFLAQTFRTVAELRISIFVICIEVITDIQGEILVLDRARGVIGYIVSDFAYGKLR